MKKRIEQTLTSMEVAEMIGKEHKNLLADIRGYIKELLLINEKASELGKLKIQPTDFFRENTYKTSQNKIMPCFDVTKKGCEFIAHKLTGIKGTEFTACYINRFHDMEDTIKESIIQTKKKSTSNRPPLSSVNVMARNVIKLATKAGIDDLFILAETKRIYSEAGYEIKIPLITDETMSKFYDCTEIAKELGIMSKTGNPHNKAVSAIIQQLDIGEDETVTTAFSRNGHDDVTVQYKPSVFDKVKNWLAENNYPTVIPCNGKNYTVTYKVVEVA